MRAGLGKGTVRYTTNHLATAANTGLKIGEEGIQKGLPGACAHRKQRSNERWQRQFAASGKRFGKTWMPCPLGKCVRCNQIRKVQQKMLYKIMGYPFRDAEIANVPFMASAGGMQC